METNRTIYFKSSDTNFSKDESGGFFEKNTPLKLNDNDEEFTNRDFEKRIKNEVGSFINRSFDNIIILAGAGSSVVSENGVVNEKYGKTVSMLAKNIAKLLGDIPLDDDTIYAVNKDPELFTLQELATMSNYPIPVVISEKEFNYKFNLENFLSNLLTYEQFLSDDKDQKSKFINSKEFILKTIIENTNYNYVNENDTMKHGRFLNILLNKIKSENKLTVVTTNYDTLFEEAAEDLEITVIDGFSFSYSPYFDSDMFDWKLVKDVPDVKTKQLEYKENVINLLKIHGSLTWELCNNDKKIRRKDKNSVNNPIMVFPSSNKYAQSYDEPYFDLFTKFQEILRKPNSLLITTGFSFADNHITKMIKQAIMHNKGLNVLISDFDIEQNHDNWKEIEVLSKDYFQIAFLKATLNGDLTDYIGD